ncbi:uncharacterized protein CANTADRAFT_29870, partial [Suhomyces tanzawaensis NRRL Y-17324]
DAMDIDLAISTTASDVLVPPAAGATENDDDEADVIQKLHNLEVLPDLFNLLHDLDSGVLLARDIDKHSGSIRLKFATLKQYLQEVEGINETIGERKARIEGLSRSNQRKCEFLARVGSRVEQ